MKKYWGLNSIKIYKNSCFQFIFFFCHQSVVLLLVLQPLAAPPRVMWHHLHLVDLLHCSFTSVHQTKLISRSTA